MLNLHLHIEKNLLCKNYVYQFYDKLKKIKWFKIRQIFFRFHIIFIVKNQIAEILNIIML